MSPFPSFLGMSTKVKVKRSGISINVNDKRSSYPFFPLYLLFVGILVWDDATAYVLVRQAPFISTPTHSPFAGAQERKGQRSTLSSRMSVCLSVSALRHVCGNNTRFAFCKKKWEKGAEADSELSYLSITLLLEER